MIPREIIWTLAFSVTLLSITSAQNSRSYDTNDWIPIPGTNNHVEKEATGKLQDTLLRTRKSSNEQYLREVSPPINRQFLNQPGILQRQQAHNPSNNFEPQLNRGEILNQFFKQPNFQHREEQQRQSHLLFKQNSPAFPMPAVFPTPRPQYTFRQPFPQNTNINAFNQNQPSSPYGFQAPLVSSLNQSATFEKLNPGIQAINQGLAADVLATNHNSNFREPPVTTTPGKPTLPADTVQLVYVPVNSLNQKPQTIQQESAETQPTVFNVLPQAQQPQVQQSQFQQQPQFQQQAQFQQQPQFLQQSQLQHRPQFQQQPQFPQQPQFQQQPQFHQQPQVRQQPQEVLFSQTQQNVQPLQFSSPDIDPHKQQQLVSIQHDFAQQALNALNLQLQFQQGDIPSVVHQPIPITTSTTTTTTTPAPPILTATKRKPHQPPLAVYMGGEGDITVSDVLSVLKNAQTISVQDAVGPNSPQVFVGPQNLEAPEGYVKFDLPYLSSLETNRIERKVDQFPFFVAPVSYKTPPGYSKILLPAPHVGSVVVSQKEQQQRKLDVNSAITNDESLTLFNQQPQTLKFQEVIDERLHRFDNQVQSSSVVPPTRRPSRPALTQTINQYELEQINNQFVPQFQPVVQDFPTGHLNSASDEYEETNVQEKDFKNFDDARSPNDFRNHNRVRNHKTNYVTTTPATSTPSHQQFFEIETTTVPSEIRHRFSGRPTQQQFSNQYTELEEFPHSSKSSSKSSTKVELNQPVGHTVQFPKHANEYHSLNEDHGKLTGIVSEPLPTIPSTTENNAHYQNQFAHFDSQPQSQDQFLNQGNRPNPTVSSEVLDDHLLDPAYQTNENGQFVSTQSNHHISHKLVQQQLEQEQLSKNSQVAPTQQPTNAQHLTEQSVKHTNLQNTFATRGRERPQFSAEVVTDTYEAVDDYKLPAHLPTISPGIHTLINDLQDPSIRPLLIPTSIAPRNDAISQSHLHRQSQQHLIEVTSTEAPISYTSTTEIPTTTQRSRGRQRARITTTTHTPRRTVQRTRRPVVRTTTERIQHQPDHSEEYNYFPTKSSRDYQRVKSYREETSTENSQRPTIRSRTRTRGRTTVQPQTTTAPVIHDNDFKQSEIFTDFQASKVNPQSYMQFEHENIPNLQYHIEHHSSTERLLVPKESSTEQQRMNIDVLINHPITENVYKEPSIISAPEGNSQYVRFSSNLDSDVVTRKVEGTTSPSHVRIQGRGRFKSRAKTTPSPITTTTVSYLTTTNKNENEEEFYGFFKPPQFNSALQPYNLNFVSTTRRPVYISNTIQYEDQPLEHSDNVNVFAKNAVSSTPSNFVGELVTKYTPTTTTITTTTEIPEIITPEVHVAKSTPRSRIRGRMRLPKNKSKEEQYTTTSEVRLRSRGKAHFMPTNRNKEQTRDEDVEGGNYPKFFPKVESSTQRSTFKITIDPGIGDQEDDEDQVPFSSIRRPKVVPAEQTVSSEEVNSKPVLNDIPIDRKIIDSQEQPVTLPVASHLGNDSSEDSHSSIIKDIISEIDKVKNDEDVITTTAKGIFELKDETTEMPISKPKGRRRGVWKLVKRPVDTFETAESQYVGKFSANSLSVDDKEIRPFVFQQLTTEVAVILDQQTTEGSTQPAYSTTEESSFLETFYKMFEGGNPEDFSAETETTTENRPEKTETTLPQENYDTTLSSFDLRNTTDVPTSAETKLDVQNSTDSGIKETTTEPNLTLQTEAWDLVKTSTATEISHETEICFRGKCVKSSDDVKPNV